MTSEELMQKIEKEEKWLIHALNDQTDVTSQYGIDIAFDAVKHYVKDYIDSQQKMGRWVKSDDHIEKFNCSNCGGACWYYDYRGAVAKSNYCPSCGARMEVGE